MTRGTASSYVKAVVPLFAFSVLGILSTAAFQLLVIRRLGPNGFGLLVAYLALINVASIGSSAVRSSVAVGVARTDLHRVGKSDRTFQESLAYGLVFAAGVVVMLLSGAYTSWWAGLWVALAIVPYFVFARAQGLMQGDGRVLGVLVWSTGAQVAQFLLALVALALGASWIGVLFVTMVVAAFSAGLSSWQVRRDRLHSSVRPFNPIAVRALLITAAFTWLISMDVAWVQRFASAESAGEYGAAATLIKVGFLVPTTLALYLLPRFARNLDDRAFQLQGLLWSAAAAAVSGLGFATILGLWPALLTVLFGESYAGAGTIAGWIALSYVPWVVSQSIVTQLTARGSVGTIALLLGSAIIQLGLAWIALPNLKVWILVQGLLGLAVLAMMLLIFALDRRRAA